jgi:hypothetical protein
MDDTGLMAQLLISVKGGLVSEYGMGYRVV